MLHLLFSVFPQAKPQLGDIISIYYHEDAFNTSVSMMLLLQQTEHTHCQAAHFYSDPFRMIGFLIFTVAPHALPRFDH